MNTKAFLVMLFIAGISDTAVILQYTAKEHFYNPYNVTRSTVSGIAAYRSSLTLDWLAAEDIRQRELAIAFETDAPVLKTVLSSDCMSYSRPSPGKIGRLMLELLKNLEGDDGIMVPELIQVLIRSKQLVETSILETEPNLDSLVKTPGLLIGEPHITFPRILAVIWMLVTDPSMTRKYGWCPINKVNSYLVNAKPNEVAKQMRSLEIVVARARFIMEEFIQSITPPNIYQKKTNKYKIKPVPEDTTTLKHAVKPRAHDAPLPAYQMGFIKTTGTTESLPDFEVLSGDTIIVSSNCPYIKLHVFLCYFVLVFYLINC